MNRLKIFGLIVSIIVLNWTAVSSAQSSSPATSFPADMFIKANQAYNEGDFEQSAKMYESLLQQVQNGYLYFNLGNSYFRLGRLGSAILNYRRAEKFTPRFDNLTSNLKHSRQKTKDKIEDKSYAPLLNNIFFLYRLLSLKEMLIIFLILNLMLFLLAILHLYVKADAVKWALFLVLGFYLISASTAAVRFYTDRIQHEGVVIADEVWVRSGDGVNNIVLFALHEGAEFKVDEVKGDWLKVSLADGNRGWTQRMGVEII